MKGTAMYRLFAVVVMLGSVVALVGCGGASTITITGSVLIENPSRFDTNGRSCTGSGFLSPVKEGAQMTIRSGGDDATATLSDGFVTGEGNCRLMFTADIPDKDAPKRYEFKVEGLPSVMGIVNTTNPIEWQTSDSDGWVTIGWN
jgi:hypothetical protein